MRSRDVFTAETTAGNVPDAVLPQVVQAQKTGRLGVSFSGAGFGASYQLGAAHMLKSLGLLNEHTPVGGTSAGSIVAVAVRCGIPFTEVLKALEAASSDLLANGFKQRIRSVLKPVLERLLPPDAHERCNSSPAVVLTASRIKGPCPACWRGQLLDEPFSSTEDLVQRLLVAIHEPRETDGRLCVRYNRGYYADGGMRLPVPPLPAADYTIIVYPVCNRLLTRTWPYKLLMHPPAPGAIAISPGQYRPWPYSKSYKESDHLVMHPQPPEVLDMLFERGRRDALSWARHVGLKATPVAVRALTMAVGRTSAGASSSLSRCRDGADDGALAPSEAAYQGRQGPAGAAGNRAVDLMMAAEADHQQHFAATSIGAASGLLSVPVEQLPMIMPVQSKLLHML